MILSKKTKVNFNNQYILVELKFNNGHGDRFNYVAINPNTKKGYVLPRDVWFMEDHPSNPAKPRMIFSSKNNTLCTSDPNLEFSSDGLHQSTNAGNKSGGKLCWVLTSSQNGPLLGRGVLIYSTAWWC